ncbi:hypothetical protein MBM_07801 [Drepanopeziza brunnea f. sp. 'multigermtubi' MB_m1]|uniref:Uncharacterized protein n=1 Tax=Marssonina brunnea f. sp. multigermtubi (strain MB_m1) TaxID=1072389 RepID=K1XNS4_MARBU|nr:uncharacterized protein MBM_07801 [Drepanopeziza brunnea f. sp. 'multigermtubi' MB_m1]EKD14124.1 hypothetical protein MBM_07801 [Drepanopeziza brunnea f. sp. 'multigermtubi' MB_m1]
MPPAKSLNKHPARNTRIERRVENFGVRRSRRTSLCTLMKVVRLLRIPMRTLTRGRRRRQTRNEEEKEKRERKEQRVRKKRHMEATTTEAVKKHVAIQKSSEESNSDDTSD